VTVISASLVDWRKGDIAPNLSYATF
jgi:hypothetical protein